MTCAHARLAPLINIQINESKRSGLNPPRFARKKLQQLFEPGIVADEQDHVCALFYLRDDLKQIMYARLINTLIQSKGGIKLHRFDNERRCLTRSLGGRTHYHVWPKFFSSQKSSHERRGF